MKPLFVVMLCALTLVAETPLPFTESAWHTGNLGYVPSTLTDVVASTDSFVDAVMFANDDASAVATIRVVDKSTNCGGAACPLWPDITLAAKTRYIALENGIFSKSGIQWKVTGSTKCVGWMKGRY